MSAADASSPTSITQFQDPKELVQLLRREEQIGLGLVVSPEETKGEPETVESALGWFLKNIDLNTCHRQNVESETTRLLNLKSYGILDREEDDSFLIQSALEFDRIVEVAKQTFDTPMAVISMVDAGRQYFISNGGLPVRETPRGVAFCAHCIQSTNGLLVVNDATQDERFRNNPLVTDGLKVRFYAGATVKSAEGKNLGTVCVIDTKPRTTTQEQITILRRLAYQAMNEITLNWLTDSY